MMNVLKVLLSSILLGAFLLTSHTSSAQCSDVYIYMPIPFLESEGSLDLYVGTTKVGALSEGTRLKASVCGGGSYDLEVVNAETNTSGKEELILGDAAEYYVKASFAPGLTVPLLKQVDVSKGRKDIRSNNKFRSGIQTLSLGSAGTASQGNGSSRGTTVENEGGSRRSQQSGGGGVPTSSIGQVFSQDGFEIEIVDISKAGSTLRFDMKVTNRTGVPKYFTLQGNNFSFYDEHGNYRSAGQVCTGADCRSETQLLAMDDATLQQKAITHHNNWLQTTLPTDIPIKLSFSIPNINNIANFWEKGQLIFGYKMPNDRSGYKTIYVPIPRFELPTDAVPNRPMARRYAQHIIELTSLQKSGENLIATLSIQNGSTSPLTLSSGGAIAYTPDGVELRAEGMYAGGVASGGYNRYQRDLGPFAAGGSGVITAEIKLNGQNPSSLAGLTVTLNGISLNWRDVAIGGSLGSKAGQTPTGGGSNTSRSPSEYVPYNTFITRTSADISLAGKKVVLDKIYFATANANLLPNSHAQLDEISRVLKADPNMKIEIAGHTDDVGDVNANIILSQRRADEVRYYLLGKGVGPAKISAMGYGETEPRVDNTSDANRQENRRVELVID